MKEHAIYNSASTSLKVPADWTVRQVHEHFLPLETDLPEYLELIKELVKEEVETVWQVPTKNYRVTITLTVEPL